MNERLHRFFVPPEWLHDEHATLKDQTSRQIARVLRMSPGDRVVLLNNSGNEYLTELQTFHANGIEGRILSSDLGRAEPQTHVTLYQSLLKGDKMDWVLQKGTELGASAFVPVLSRRSIARAKRGEEQMGRWRRIVAEAAEQSGRSVLPEVYTAMPLADALQQLPHGIALIPYEDERERPIREALHAADDHDRMALFIGPEGGWDPEEITLARNHGAVPVSMGERILRAETAAIAAITIAMYSHGELGGELGH